VIDTITNTVIGSPIPVGNGPTGLALYGSLLYVSNFFDNTVSVIDTDTDTVIETIPGVGPNPSTGAINATSLYFGNQGGNTVSVIGL
jgi:YVTN family beta-propeller protein